MEMVPLLTYEYGDPFVFSHDTPAMAETEAAAKKTFKKTINISECMGHDGAEEPK